MRWSRIVFLVLFCAGPAILSACAIAIVVAGLFGMDPVWRQTEFDLRAAVLARSRVAARVLAERAGNVDAPVDYSGPEVGRSEPVRLAPLVIAALLGYDEIVRILLEAGSDPAVAFSSMSPDVAAALRRYAVDKNYRSLREFLAKYNTGPELTLP
jgi:hypothetical protein